MIIFIVTLVVDTSELQLPLSANRDADHVPTIRKKDAIDTNSSSARDHLLDHFDSKNFSETHVQCFGFCFCRD